MPVRASFDAIRTRPLTRSLFCLASFFLRTGSLKTIGVVGGNKVAAISSDKSDGRKSFLPFRFSSSGIISLLLILLERARGESVSRWVEIAALSTRNRSIRASQPRAKY